MNILKRKLPTKSIMVLIYKIRIEITIDWPVKLKTSQMILETIKISYFNKIEMSWPENQGILFFFIFLKHFK